MNIIFLFNANDINLNNCYGSEIEKKIWSCNVLQKSADELKIFCGDIVPGCFTQSKKELKLLFQQLFSEDNKHYLNFNKLEYVFEYDVVYAWMISNLSLELAEQINSLFSEETSYLGMAIVPKHSVPEKFYLYSLPEKYILKDCSLEIVNHPFSDDDYEWDIAFLHQFGFNHIGLKEYDNGHK